MIPLNPKGQRLPVRLLPPTVMLLLMACSSPDDASSRLKEYASQARPSDPQLAEIYQRSCHTCHGAPGSGAPLTGDTSQWDTLQEKGMQVLLSNVVNGIEGMPPYGLCMDCSAADFRALIRFMAKPPEGH